MAKDITVDKELESYRNLMTAPGTFEEGFTWSSLLGAAFIALLMVPGSMYMGLVAGMGVGGAAQWVMVILFIEVAKRAHKTLPKAQIFILFYMTSAAMATPFGGLLWNQFFVQSEAVVGQGMAEQIPFWYAPSDPRVLAARNFFHPAWWPALGMVLFGSIIGRIDNAVLGYGLFKLVSDIEKLPFPMAPIGAQGIIALAEDMDEKEQTKHAWRWRAFAIGGAIGLVFGFIYLGIPTLSSAFLGKTIQLFPIPFADWTGRTYKILPAFATGLSFDMGSFIVGMVIPFWAVVGAFAGLIMTMVMNPLLYHARILTWWQPGDSTIETLFKNTVDFYFSFGIGVSLAVACIGLGAVFRGIRQVREHRDSGSAVIVPKGRGDIPVGWIGGVYLVSTLLYMVVCGILINWHTGIMMVLCFYGFVYTPIISYVTARLEGMVGQALAIPFVREAGILLSGYQGIACWFLPIPLHNYGTATMFYRKAELTGTKFTSKWKTEAILVPFVLVSSIIYAQFIWSIGPIPSSQYPFADMMWELQAKNSVLLFSSTSGGYSQFLEAFKPMLIGIGWGAGMILFWVLRMFSAPTMLLYGAVKGLSQTMPHTIIPEMMGALLARFYFEKKMGLTWRQYAPVVSAGFGCGAGLIGMFCIGVKFMATAVYTLPY